MLTKVILRGRGASRGIATGMARRVYDKADLVDIKVGEVLITEMTDIDYIQAMRKVAAVITEIGSITCHAAIVSREFGIPCVVAVGPDLWSAISTGSTVRVDGTTGVVEVM